MQFTSVSYGINNKNYQSARVKCKIRIKKKINNYLTYVKTNQLKTRASNF